MSKQVTKTGEPLGHDFRGITKDLKRLRPPPHGWVAQSEFQCHQRNHKEKVMITVSIDVTKIDKARLKEVKKRDGSTAKYLELVLIETPNGQYGDFMVKQGVTKEEREKRVEMPILGNGKIFGGNNRPARTETNTTPKSPKSDDPFA